jgi:hypothetical protein
MAPLKALGLDGYNVGFFKEKIGTLWVLRFVKLSFILSLMLI